VVVKIERRPGRVDQFEAIVQGESVVHYLQGDMSTNQSKQTYTIPYISSNPGIYAEIRDKWREIAADYLNDITHLTSQCSADFQPLPSIIGQHSEERGGNAMGLLGADPDRLILELQCSWTDSNDDGVQYEMSRAMTEWLAERIPQWLASANQSIEDFYLPYFMNDATDDQPVTKSYKGYEKFKALQEEVDPQGFFSTRAGGFKY
jgi:hypothetical protein